MPAIAVSQRVRGDPSRNRPKGCVGSLFDLVLRTGFLLGINFISIKWNFAGVNSGIVTVRQNFKK